MVLGYSSTYSTIGGTGGAATVTLTAAQSGVPAHSHGTTVTQPVFKYKAPTSHTHTLNQDNAYAYLSVTSSIRYRYTSLASNWNAEYGTTASLSDGAYSSSHKDVVSLGGKTEAATGGESSANTTASRTTNVAVTVDNNTAAAATSAHNNMPPYYVAYI
jgi:microcystin-dependent protein